MRPVRPVTFLTNVTVQYLIITGLILLVAGLLWPYMARPGPGRLPGDIVIERGGTTFHLPIMTSLVLSLVYSVVLWLLSR